MIYRRPIRDVVEERHGRTCGMHVFVFYLLALTAILGMSIACLSATDEGYFRFDQSQSFRIGSQNTAEDFRVDYEITYGWRSMCAAASSRYVDENNNKQELERNGCFGLERTKDLYARNDQSIKLAAGSPMTADTGLAVALGHAGVAAISAVHIFLFLMLHFNVDPVPVRGYPYMRGLGLMSGLSSFYLLFTCVVSFYFGVKGSLEVDMETSTGLRPSWAYVITVLDVTTLVVVGMMACQDDEVDAAIATPQYTSSSRDEDTVKRASGKLLHLRSKSSDTICDRTLSALAQSQPPCEGIAPKMTVAGGVASGGRQQHPAASSITSAGSLGGGPSASGSASRMSAAAASAAAHAASTFGRLASSPVPSASVMSSWTARVSGLSPVGRRQEGGGRNTGDDDGSGGSGNEADGEDVDDGERRDEENAWGRDGRREEGGSGYEGENHSRRTSLTRDDNMFASNNTVLLDSGFCTGAGMGAVNHELEMMNGGGNGGLAPPATSAAGGIALWVDEIVDLEVAGDSKKCDTTSDVDGEDRSEIRPDGRLSPSMLTGVAALPPGETAEATEAVEQVLVPADTNSSIDFDDLEQGLGLETSPISTSAVIFPISARRLDESESSTTISTAPVRRETSSGTVRGTVPGFMPGSAPGTAPGSTCGDGSGTAPVPVPATTSASLDVENRRRTLAIPLHRSGSLEVSPDRETVNRKNVTGETLPRAGTVPRDQEV